MTLSAHDPRTPTRMPTPNGGTLPQASHGDDILFSVLGGEAGAIDLWTRVDSSWLDEGAAQRRDAVGYAGMPVAHRVAGLTLGDADATPFCAPFLVEINTDRLAAQFCMPRSATLWTSGLGALTRWASGSLSKDLRVVRFPSGDIGLEADAHLLGTGGHDWVREFVTAFSWDVAALHTLVSAGSLTTTEEWVQRAALSISRSTPRIPLRRHAAPEWQAHETPRGVFCSLQPSGGVCASDNVLYSVRRDA
ncbi:MAG TPA: hypothetical protein VE861_00630, partial [Gemmatimonadaceae bacterium]|nr:hypothetical protein [Gemmatimonadaceae bacterium]